jgi:hypothetical protein
LSIELDIEFLKTCKGDRMRHALILTLTLAIFALSGYAQGTFATVIRDAEGDEYGRDLVQTPDGGYMFTGDVVQAGRTDSDIAIGKFNSEGELVWMKAIGGTGRDKGYSIIKNGSYYYATGYYHNGMAGYQNICLVKFDEAGVVTWAKQLIGVDSDEGKQIINTSDGGYAIAGHIYDTDAANDLAIIKFDSADNLEWMTRVGTENHVHGFSIAELRGGGFVVVGDVYLEGAVPTRDRSMIFTRDNFIVRLSSTGALESATAHYDADGAEYGKAVTATSDGGFLVASEVPAWGWGQSDILLSKFNSSGFNEWSKLLGHWSYDTPYRIIGTSDGGYLISGDFMSPTRSIQAGLLKLDSSCNLEWMRCGGGTSYEYGYGVIQTPDGGFAQIGMSWSYGSTNEIMLIKYDSEGYYCEPDSQSLYTSDHSIMFEPVMVDVNTSPLVLETFTPDIVTLSRRDSLLCAGMDVEEPALPMNSAISVHPNPFNASVAISAPRAERVEIVDINGRIVEVIEGDFSSEAIWSPSEGTATGVYFVRARYSDGSSAEQRAVFMK